MYWGKDDMVDAFTYLMTVEGIRKPYKKRLQEAS